MALERAQIVAAGTIEVPVVAPGRFFAHGWHSWCPTMWVDPHRTRRAIRDRVVRLGHDDPVHAFDEIPGGSAVGAVAHGDRVTLVGALGPDGWVRLDGSRLVGAYDGEPGTWFVAHGTNDDVFGAYAEALGASLGRRGGDEVRLWSSWYSYGEDIDEQRIAAVVDGLGDLSFDTVQVDDGWQRAIGDWEPNDRFRSGLEATAQRIRDTGRRAGLWLAPFIVAPDSDTARQRPEMLLRDEEGAPVVAGENWGGPYFALDVTHPETESYLEELFGALGSAGFDFFKLDFVYAAAYPGRRAMAVGREAAYRRGLLMIRRAVGDDTYLLACGAPVVASLGVCDGIRIGPDVAPWWVDPEAPEPTVGRGTRNAIATAVHRLWLRPVTDVDPDVVYFRGRDVQLSDVERRHLQLLAQVAGFRGCSDPPDWLTGAERAQLGVYLSDQSAVSKISPFAWRVGDELVDFAGVVDEAQRRELERA